MQKDDAVKNSQGARSEIVKTEAYEECWGCEDSAKERARVVAIISHHCTIDLPSADAARIAEIQQRQDGRRAETESDARYIADIDYLLSLLPAPQSGWLPIADAPKDGTAVLILFSDGAIAKARWEEVDWNEQLDKTSYDWVCVGCVSSEHDEPPVGWLPAPPVTDTEGEQK